MVCSVTLIVATNDLQQRWATENKEILQILNDFNHLLDQLRSKFVNASIGILNVMPRTVTSSDGVTRISLFNGVMMDRALRKPKTTWIKLYEELLNPVNRLINTNLFTRDGLHLNAVGKGILNSKIRDFQDRSFIENYGTLAAMSETF